MNTLYKLFIIFCFTIFFHAHAFSQTTYYWVGGSTGNINAGSNWSSTSGGVAGSGTITFASSDVLIFDTNSVSSITVTNNGGNPTNIGKLQISGSRTVQIQNPSGGTTGLTINSATSDALIIGSGSTLINHGISSTYTHTITLANSSGLTADISGTLRNNNNNTYFIKNTNATIIFRDGGTYHHNRSLLGTSNTSIPISTWEDGSSCIWSGDFGNFQASMQQDFYNLTISCENGINAYSMNSNQPTNVRGTFTINSTGSSGSLVLGHNQTLNVNNFIINGGIFYVNNSSTTDGAIINVNGDFTINGGNFFGSTQSARISTLNIEGSLIRNGGNFYAYNGTTAGAGYLAINFSNSSGLNRNSILKLQSSLDRLYCKWNITVNSGRTITLDSDIPIGTTNHSTNNRNMTFTVNDGAVLTTGNYVIQNGSGTYYSGNEPRFSLNSGGTLITANTNGITSSGASGSIQVTGTRTFNTAANYTYNGSSSQNTGSGLPATVNNLTINNTHANGVSLSNSTTVNGTLTLTQGLLTLGSNHLTLSATSSIAGSPSANNMIVPTSSGELRKVFTSNSSFTFPVGDNSGTAEYSPVNLNFTSGSYSSAYAAVRLSNSKHPNNNSANHYINRYWIVNTSGITSPECTATFYYTDGGIVGTESNLFGGRRLASEWNCLDAVNTANNSFSKSINAFGDFTAGERNEMKCCESPTDGGIIAENQDLCSTDIIAELTNSTAASGNEGTLEYKWQLSTTSDSGPWSDIAESNSESFTPASLTQTTWFRRLARVDCKDDWSEAVFSNVLTLTYNIAPTAPTSISGENSVCNEGSTSLTANGGSDGDGAVFQWGTGTTIGENIIIGETANSYTTPALTENTSYWVRRIGNSANCTNPTNGVSISITVTSAPAAPTATKSPNVATVCEGQILTLADVTDNGGGTGNCEIEYRHSTDNGATWSDWSDVASSFAAVAGENNLIEIRKTCDGNNCGSSTASQYAWAVTTAPSAPTATKSPNVATVCEGQTLTLADVTDNGGGTGNCEIEYRHSTDNGATWSAWSDVASSFAAVAGENNLIEIRKTCDGNNCGSSTASQYAWAVTTAPSPPTATKSPNVATVCEGQILTLADVTDNGGGTGNCEIEYRHSTDNGATWSAWSNVASNFAAVAGNDNLIEIRKTCDGDGCNTSSTASQYAWAVTSAPSAPTATKSPDVATVCEGQILTLADVTDNGGGTGNCEIEYRHSTDNGATWSAWSNVASNFAAVAGNDNLIEIRKTCDGNNCGSSTASQYSWAVTSAPSAPTATKSPNVTTVCEGQILTLADVTDNGGGTGTCEIEYRHSTDNGANWSTWSDVASSFAAVTGDDNLIEIRKTCDGDGCNTSSTASQYAWAVTSAPSAPTATKSPDVATVCEGQILTLADVTDNGGGTGNCEIEYRHSTDNGATWSAWSNVASNFAAVAGNDNLIEIRKTCDGNNCGSSTASQYSWAVTSAPSAPTATKSPNVTTVCEGQILTLADVTDNGGGTGTCEIEYRHSTDNGANWSTWSDVASSFAAVAGDDNLIEIRKTCDGDNCGSSTASQYSWSVTTAPSAPTATKSPNVATVCEGQVLTLADVTDNGGGTGSCEIEYRHSTDNGATWSAWSDVASSFAAVAGENNLIEIRKTCDGDNCGSSTASQYSWAVDPVSEILTQPISGDVCRGGNYSLIFDVTGINLNYQWEISNDNIIWNNIDGETNAELSLTNIQSTAYYRCNVSYSVPSQCSGFTSNIASVVVNYPVPLVINALPEMVCNGGSANIEVSFPPIFVASSFEWQDSTSTSGVWQTMVGENSQVLNTGALSEDSYIRCIVSWSAPSGCNSDTTEIQKIEIRPDITIIENPSSTEICEGGNHTMTVVAQDGIAPLFYRWESSSDETTWNTISGAVNNQYTTPALNQTTYYRCIVFTPVSGCDNAISTTATVTVQPAVQFTLQPADTSYLCNGGEITLTTTASGGIGSISYQWQKLNGTNWENIAGQTNNNLTINTITENSQYRNLAWGNTGNNCDTAISNIAYVMYQEDIEITIVPDSSFVCDQGEVVLTVQVPNGSIPLSYQWQTYDGLDWNDVIGENSETISITNIDNDYIYRCIIEWNAQSQCNQSISNEAYIFKIEQEEIVANSIPSVIQICDEGIFSVECVVGPNISIQSYQWQYSANNTDWIDISGANNAIYSTDTLSESAYFRAIVTPVSSTNCFSIASESTHVEILPEIIQTNITSDQTICQNASINLEITTGGGVAPMQYQWQTSNDNISWNDISGAQNSTYNANNIINLTYFRCIVKSSASGCDSLISTVIQINIGSPINIDSHPENRNICTGGNSSISVSASGGIGNLEYQWQVSTNQIDWSDLVGENNSTFNITNAVQGTFYYRCIIGDDATNACPADTSNISTMEVVDFPIVNITPTLSSICEGGQLNIETNNNSGFTIQSYQWQSSIDSTNWLNITDEISFDYTTSSLSQTHWYRVELSWDASHSCNNSQSEISKIYIVDDVQITTQPAPANHSLCIGEAEQISIVVEGGINLSYQWQVSNDLLSWNDIIGEESAQLDIPTSIAGTYYYRCIVNSNGIGCTPSTTSDYVTRIINPDIEITTQPTAQTICTGGTANLNIEHSVGNGNPFSYSWEISDNGIDGWTEVGTTQNYTTDVLTATKYYRCTISQDANSCGSITSNVVSIQVVPDPSIVQQPTANVSLCQQEDQALSVQISDGTGTITYQWQSSSTSGSGFANIDTSTNATFYPSTENVGTTYYRCIINISGNGCTSPLTSDESEFTVNGKVFITQQPLSQAICIPHTLNLSVESSDGNGDTKHYQWEYSHNSTVWSNIGTDSPNLSIDTLSTNAYFRVTITQDNNICGDAVSNISTISVFDDFIIDAISSSPAYTCENNPIFLAVLIDGGTGLNYQWKISDTWDGTFENVTEGTGGTSNIYFPPVDSPYEAWFKCEISSTAGGCDTKLTDTINLIVIPDFHIDTQPEGATICSSGDHSMNITISGGSDGDEHTFQWLISTDGINYSVIPGAYEDNYTATNITQTTWFKAVAYQSVTVASCGHDTSQVALVTVVADPAIASQTSGPISTCINDPQNLNISISGGVDIFYQWQVSDSENGTYENVSSGSGGTTANYLPPTNSAGTYWYQCIVSINGEGCNPSTIEGNKIEYIVQPDFIIEQQPSGEIICADGSATLTVVVSAGNGENINYQWQESDDNVSFSPISGANNNTLNALGTNGSKYYRCVINQDLSLCPTKTSNSAFVEVYPALQITTQPNAEYNVCDGSNTPISISISGGYNNSFQWQESDNNIDFADIIGANSSSYTPPAMPLGTTKYYRCIVSSTASSGCDDIISNTATYNVQEGPEITAQPSNATVCSGSNHQLSITATISSGTLTYQWQISTTGCGGSFSNISGANESTYDATNISQTSYYRCIVGVENLVCNTISDCATITIETIPNITQQPQSSSICLGETENISISTSGGSNVSYQWQISDNNCSGTWNNLTDSTNLNISITPSTTSHYRVAINYGSENTCTRFSNCAIITVSEAGQAPTVTKFPNVDFVCAEVSLTVMVENCTDDNYITEYKLPGSDTWVEDWAFQTDIYGTAYMRARCVGGSGNCPSEWAEVSWEIVETAPSPSIARTPDIDDICANALVSATTVSGITTSTSWQRSTNGGTSWSAYTPTNQISTSNVGDTILQIRGKYLQDPSTGCLETGWSSVNWNVHALPQAANLTPTPNADGTCLNTEVEASIGAGNGGINGLDETNYSIDAGNTWSAYVSDLQIPANVTGSNQIIIQSIRTSDGYGCTNDTITKRWNVYNLPVLTDFNIGCPTYDYNKVELLPSGSSGTITNYHQHSPINTTQASSIMTIPFAPSGYAITTGKFTVTDNYGCKSDTLSINVRRPWGYTTTTASGTCFLLGNDQWAYVTRADHSVLIGIHDQNQIIGLTAADVYVDAATNFYENTWYLKRHYVINTNTNPINPVQVRLYFTTGEFEELQTLSTTNANNQDDVHSMNNLKVTKYDGPFVDGSYANNDFGNPSYFSVLTPHSHGFDSQFSINQVLSYVDINVGSFSEFWIHGGTSTESWLPVELLAFDAYCQKPYTIFKWATASETNNHFFTLQESIDGVQYYNIDTIIGAGNSNQLNVYELSHKNTNNNAYYRLTQTDFDGKQSIFAPINVSCSGSQILEIFPNPFKDFVTIKGEIASEMLLELYSGIQKVDAKTIEFEGEYKYDLSNLKPGIYMLRVTSNNNTTNFKLIKN